MKALLSFFFIGLIYSISYSQCTNASAFGTVAAPTTITPVTISTCSFQSEYSTITGVVAGSIYQATVSSASCITVHSGTPGGPIVASGPSPLNFTATVSGTYYLHYNTNCACGLASTCVTTTIACTSCGAVTPCTTTTNIAGCGIGFILSTTGASSFVSNICSPTPGLESIYSYTATSTGNYSINVTGITGGSYAFGWKLSSAGCSGTGWNCIGTMAAPGSTPTFAFVAGTTYLFLIDAMQTTASTLNFQLTCPVGAPTTAGDCPIAVNVCSSAAFAIDPNGFGTTNEICAAGTCVSNPSINPGSANSGCLLSGELNSTWMKVNVLTGGNLTFSLGTPFSGTFNCLDWSMWPYSATACAAISAGTLAPVRCNYNGGCEEFTGLASAMPAGATAASNWEPPLPVASGSIYLICLSNYSSANTSVPLSFGGTAVVSCTPLSINDLMLYGESESTHNQLNWTVQGEINSLNYVVERSTNGINFEEIGSIEALNSGLEEVSYSFEDYTSEMGMNYYRIKSVKNSGSSVFSSSLGLNTVYSNNFKIVGTYPNPTSDEFTIKMVSNQKEDVIYRLIAIDGSIVEQKTISVDKGINQIDLNTNSRTGLFYIEISSITQGKIETEKIVFN
jgi:Secretion system C-terminal sorting domain